MKTCKRPWELYIVETFTLQNFKFKPAHLLFSRKRHFFLKVRGIRTFAKRDLVDKILSTIRRIRTFEESGLSMDRDIRE
uniref:Uncharacterized protein n=1 Tax=Romanomermis culicivorax TaxID=13658 RepID=A0A915K1X9_ROMCU